MKRLLAMLCLAGLALMPSGCGGRSDDSGIRNAIDAKIDSFKTAVEKYDVPAMLAFLDADQFSLTIAENDSSYDKTYEVLADELQEDQAKQLHWREPAPEGHGYILTMELGAIAFDNLSSSGGIATVPFTVKEKAEGIPQMVTDTGVMVCEMANPQGIWSCRRMTISFNAPPKARSVRDARAGGLGFGRFDFGAI